MPFFIFSFFSVAFFDLFFIFSRTETINHPRTVARTAILPDRSFVDGSRYSTFRRNFVISILSEG